MFRAFTGSEFPGMNQAEVIHTSWVNRDKCGGLEVSADLDMRDSMFLDAEFRFSQNTASIDGCGPTHFELPRRLAEWRMESMKMKGRDLMLHWIIN